MSEAKNRIPQEYVITNRGGLKAIFIDFGATLTHLYFKDKHGKERDLVLGFPQPSDYLVNVPYFGSTVGQVANRVAHASFQLNGKTYELDKNNGDHHLHGGCGGFSHRYWQSHSLATNSVEFELTTSNGDCGYPGSLNCFVNFTLTDCNQLIMDYRAELNSDPTASSQPLQTVINLTNHSYFNLDGFMSADPTVHNHIVTINSNSYLEKSDMVVTGKVLSVNDCDALDFTKPKRIGDDIKKVDGGYDHCYVLDSNGCEISGGPLREVAQVHSPDSGITMRVSTTEPSVQFYTGNFLDREIPAKSYEHHADFTYDAQYGLCLETQRFPNAVNIPEWIGQCTIGPGHTYKQKTIYHFLNV